MSFFPCFLYYVFLTEKHSLTNMAAYGQPDSGVGIGIALPLTLGPTSRVLVVRPSGLGLQLCLHEAQMGADKVDMLSVLRPGLPLSLGCIVCPFWI